MGPPLRVAEKRQPSCPLKAVELEGGDTPPSRRVRWCRGAQRARGLPPQPVAFLQDFLSSPELCIFARVPASGGSFPYPGPAPRQAVLIVGGRSPCFPPSLLLRRAAQRSRLPVSEAPLTPRLCPFVPPSDLQGGLEANGA